MIFTFISILLSFVFGAAVHVFYNLKYNQKPPIILLDCSKLQLGRGRIDDTVSSFRRRLELFRELTLPMLKTLDNEGRLTIVSIFNPYKSHVLFKLSTTCIVIIVPTIIT